MKSKKGKIIGLIIVVVALLVGVFLVGKKLSEKKKTSLQLTVKYNGEVGGKNEYIDVSNSQKRVLIDTKNQVFSAGGANLSQKDNHYTISFCEEDAEKDGVKGRLIFSKNNTNFQL